MTNGDRIRAMSDDELQHLLDTATDSCHYRYCDDCPLKYSDKVPRCNIGEWLKQEVQEDAGSKTD